MRVLVTGGAGFIGSHLVEALLRENYVVRVLDDLSSGHLTNLERLACDFIEGDVADFEKVQTAVSGCDIIFHQAALVSVPRSVKEPALNHKSNVTGPFNVFEAGRLAGVKRIVYASSAAVYGDLPGLPKRESDPIAPLTPYAVAKSISEQFAAVYAQLYGVSSVGLRYMNVFGPRQDPSSPYSGVLSIFCQKLLAGERVTIFGDGEQSRDFVFVHDVVQANMLAAFGQNQDGLSGVYNVGRGEQTTLNGVVEMLEEIDGRSIPVTYQPARQGDIRHSVADISKIKQDLEFEPQTAVAEGLHQTLAWIRSTDAS